MTKQKQLFDPCKDNIYLIDGTAYIHRAFHAIRNLSNSKGLPTNAVFGVTRMLLKLLDERKPKYAVVAFDAKGHTFRHQLYEAYKANRSAMPEEMAVQIPWIKKITAHLGLSVEELEGFEADDLIGTYSRQAQEQGLGVVMVTGDKDFMQLVTEKAVIWDPMKERTVDTDLIQKETGLWPHQVIDMMGFSGDSADNVPGVPGIGPKTAQMLIHDFGSMDGVYNRIDELAKKKKQHANLLAHEELAYLSRKLVTIEVNAPVTLDLDSVTVDQPDADQLTTIFGELEFRQLQQQFGKTGRPAHKEYRVILTEPRLYRLVDQLQAVGLFAIDTETTSENPMQAELVGISIAFEKNRAWYIPCGHEYPDAPEQLPLEMVLKRLQPVLTDSKIGKVGQNIKYDWTVLKRHGVNLNGVVFDTMVASYLLNPSQRSHGLDQIALNHLGHKTITFDEVTGGNKKMGFQAVAIEKAGPYACEDADITLLAKDFFAPELKKLGLTRLFDEVEMPLVGVLQRMEERGICVDQRRLVELSNQFSDELESLEKDIFTEAGEAFNVKSSQQLGRILFEKLKLPVQKKTRKRTGYSTDVEVLTTLAAEHTLPKLVLRHRSLAKLKSTYADALLEMVHPETGRIHTSFNQTVAATGRLSSSDPNLQNIPIRTKEGRAIRSAFVPQKGWRLLSLDYSQIELRLLAHVSQDPILIEAFKEEEDIHTRTASEVFGVLPEGVSGDLRRQAKVINFGIIYGMGAFSLAKELGITQKMAQIYIEHYFERYQGVKAYIAKTIEAVQKSGRTSTLLGRIRLLPEIGSGNFNVRSFAERTAVNTPIQGSAADLIKVAMIQAEKILLDEGFEAAMLLSVHDEIIFEVPEKEIEPVSALVIRVMENVWALDVPLKVNAVAGANWAEAH